MLELIAELTRLYLLEDQQCEGRPVTPAWLEQQLRGETCLALDMVSGAGMTRTLVLRFDGAQAGKGDQQWEALCAIANALQNQLDLPAPAVSISGSDGFILWLSLASPVPAAQARRFVTLLSAAHAPDGAIHASAAEKLPEATALPPCLHPVSHKWAAFIHPGMGTSFAAEPGLDMAPPLAAQAGFLASLTSITPAQFARALDALEQSHGNAAQAVPPSPQPSQQGLLLKDATLDDIVTFLHQKNIEPTFRYLIEPSRK